MLLRFRTARRRKLLAAAMDAALAAAVRANLAFMGTLSLGERERVMGLARVLVSEKYWEGGRGFVVTEEMKLTIAAQACLLLLGLEIDPLRDAVYPNVRTIIVYDTGYIAPQRRMGPGGVVTEGGLDAGPGAMENVGGVQNLGEAWYRGPVIVAWDYARDGGRHSGDGRNLVLHEFAHKLDMLDGVVDGTPPLPTGEHYTCWREVMSAAYGRLISDAQTGRATVLDKYGATNPAEFFAVATEAFFERPGMLKQTQTELYETLRCYYGQDPAGRG